MVTIHGLRLLLALACLALAARASPGLALSRRAARRDRTLVARLEQALAAGDRAALLALTVKDTDASTVDEFARSGRHQSARGS